MSSHSTVAREVDEVFTGALTYDDAGVEAQRRVRQEWDLRMAQRRSQLDFAAEFRARGRSWSECDDDGNVVIRR